MTKKEAIKEAKKLQKIIGKDWTIDVWEDIDDWCYRLFQNFPNGGSITLCISYPNRYYCLTSRDMINCGDLEFNDKNFYDDPKEAIKNSIKKVKEYKNQINEFYNYIKEINYNG